jgi:hypothetical protein
MARKLIYWTCDGCGETLQGVMIDGGRDFVSDKELAEQKCARVRAVGCYLCGCMTGEVGPEVDEEEVAPS